MTIDAQADFRLFRALVAERFTEPLREFGYAEAECHQYGGEMWIVLRNEVTGINVHFEYGSGVWMTIHLLPRDRNYNVEELLERRSFDLSSVPLFRDFEAAAIALKLTILAQALREHASNCLQGDVPGDPPNELYLEREAALQARLEKLLRGE